MCTLQTTRLILREWSDKDIEPFAKINSDSEVMKFFPKKLTIEESRLFIQRMQEHFKDHGFGIFACELKEQKQFIGFVGLSVPTFKTDFTPCVEIGWRLAKEYWNKGYATEAARIVLEYGFKQVQLNEIVSFTVPQNKASQKVMQKIGMTYVKNFPHPRLPDGDWLQEHVLYKITKQEFRK